MPYNENDIINYNSHPCHDNLDRWAFDIIHCYFTQCWKKNDFKIISIFEENFEKIGILAIIIQVISGIWMSVLYLPISNWFDFTNPISSLISTKLILLALTIALAIHARFVIIPKLDNSKIPLLQTPFIAVTIISIIFFNRI